MSEIAAVWGVVLEASMAVWSRQRGFRPFRGHWLQQSHQLSTQHGMLWAPKYYPSMLSHCIHSLYFSVGIKQHRCRLPGVSVLQLTPVASVELREQGGRKKEFGGFCSPSCSVRRTVGFFFSMITGLTIYLNRRDAVIQVIRILNTNTNTL